MFASHEVVAGRYEIGPQLGRGGVAVVHRARDLTTGIDLANKRLRDDSKSHRERAIELFEREFHTLSQLDHPNVVAAYDYGVDVSGPYYTMELLDGGDLLECAPLDWRAACSLARDVCSVFSLLHSRRLVYRDLNPRNVRCASGGQTKLLDFGAMTPMGPTKFFVGTLELAAPEVIHLQPLDARTDLYSLGANLYIALVGKRPFVARDANELIEAWKSPPLRPSERNDQIPEALDTLVMDLLQLDPGHRPADAGEVMARLAAVADLSQDEAPVVARAYLATPSLVGREAPLSRAEASLTVAQSGSGNGSALLVQGHAGTGRSRFLDACVLVAKASGTSVLRADASDSTGRDYGVIRALARRLLEAAPEPAIDVARQIGPVLAAVLPELGDRLGGVFAEPFDPVRLEVELQPGLRDWFIGVAAARPLLIAVDDVDRLDPASAAVTALLCRSTREHRLSVATTADLGAGAPNVAIQSITQLSHPIRLHRLSERETERMLSSLFGEVPNVAHVAHRIHAIAHGRPREIMQLARHLIDRGKIVYRAGVWSLPESLGADELPADMLGALRARVETLCGLTGQLAQAFALAPDLRYNLDECLMLMAAGTREVLAALDTLVAAELVTPVDDDFMLAHPGMHPAILAASAPADRELLHRRLAALFQGRSRGELRAVSHLFAAGADEAGLDMLIGQAIASVQETDRDPTAFAALLGSLPADWLDLYRKGIELCRRFGRPRAQAFALQVRIAGIAAFSKVDATAQYEALYAQLTHDAGLDLYAATSGSVPERLKSLFALATQRYEETPEDERCSQPMAAIQLLSRMVIAGVGNAGLTLSVELARSLPNLEPLVPIAPAIALVQQLAIGLQARVLGAVDTVRTIYSAIVQQLGEQSLGLDATYRESVRMSLSYVLATIEATLGLSSSLDRAAQIERSPLHEVNANLIRMVYRLWQGDTRAAQRCKDQVELLNLERMRPQGVDGGHLPCELRAHIAMDDLTKVRQLLDAVEPMATRLPGWRSVALWARGEYERIRGDLPAAARALAEALATMAPEGHAVWADVAASQLYVLSAQGRAAEACVLGDEYLARAEAGGLTSAGQAIRMAFAIALANQGEIARALELSDGVIAFFEALGSTGLNVYLAHETRARIALLSEDAAAFQEHAERCRAQLPAAVSGGLGRKFERLLRQARAGRSPTNDTPDGALSRSQIASAIDHGVDEIDRAKRCLDLLLIASGAEDGALYKLDRDELILIARRSDELPLSITELAYELIEAERADDDMLTDSSDRLTGLDTRWTVDDGSSYKPVMLRHESEGGFVASGLALLRVRPDRAFHHPTRVAVEVAKQLITLGYS